MSYFDHVRCKACRASLDPEELGPQGMVCPKCGAKLSMTDLFGLKASFAEDDLPELGLDDLVGKVAQPGADYKAPLPPPKAVRAAPIRPTAVSPPPAPQGAPAPRVRSIGLSSPGAPPAALVPAGPPVPPAEAPPAAPPARRVPGQTSAADVMRALKKKK